MHSPKAVAPAAQGNLSGFYVLRDDYASAFDGLGKSRMEDRGLRIENRATRAAGPPSSILYLRSSICQSGAGAGGAGDAEVAGGRASRRCRMCSNSSALKRPCWTMVL